MTSSQDRDTSGAGQSDQAAVETNARLIAAELYEAGSLMVNDYQTSDQHHPQHVLVPLAAFEALRAAITKATTPSREGR